MEVRATELIVFFFFGPTKNPPPPVIFVFPPPAASSTVSSNQGLITALSDAVILTYFVQSDGIIALKSTGEVVKINNSKTDILSSAKLVAIISASFSSDGKKILAKFGTQKEQFFSVLDLETKLWTGLGKEKLQSVDWSPATHEIAYLEKGPSGSNIGVFNTDKLQDAKKPELGFAKTTLDRINELDSNITWLTKNEIIIYPKPAKYVPSTILKYNIKEKTFAPVLSNVPGATVNWDKKTGVGIEYSFSNNKNTITLLDASGVVRGQMGFVTMPEKCTFAGGYLYCAIPNDLNNANLPDDYLMRAVFFRDNFYRISLSDGKTDLVLQDPLGMFDAKALSVSGGKMYFLNNLDSRLYEFTMQAK